MSGRVLGWANHLFRGVLPSVVCRSVVEEPHEGGLVSLGVVRHEKRTINYFLQN